MRYLTIACVWLVACGGDSAPPPTPRDGGTLDGGGNDGGTPTDGGEMDGAGELTEAGGEQRLLGGGVIDGGDFFDQTRDFIEQRRDPLGVGVAVPAQAVFAGFDGSSGALMDFLSAIDVLQVVADGLAGGFEFGGEAQRQPQRPGGDAADKTCAKNQDPAQPGHAVKSRLK